jgi:hypothetical protein
MMRKSATTVVALSVLTWFALPARAVIIDDFEDGPFSLTSTSPNYNGGIGTGESGLVGVIGGQRGPAVLLWDQGYTSGSAVFALDLSGAGDHGASLSVPAGRTATAGCYYPGPSEQGLGLDLLADGASAFQFTFANDPGNGSLDFSVFTTNDHWASIPLTGAGTYQIPFSAFGLSSADLAQVKTLYFDLIYSAGSQPIVATLSDVRTVPEPSTLILMAMGICGLVASARWRR